MKSTEFKPGEFCRFPNSEIPEMLDLLRDNGHLISDRIDKDEDNAVYFSGHSWGPAWLDGHYGSMYKDTELTLEQFMFKATRGKQENAQVEFDSSKPFEVSHDGEHWHSAPHYVGRRSNGEHCVEINATLGTWQYIRNVPEPFNASMLEVGEYMVVEDDRNINANGCVLRRNRTELLCVRGFLLDYTWTTCCDLKGRRVRVNITTEEV